jgi:hypothetical protein
VRDIRTLDDLRATVRVVEETRCWQFLKENGDPVGPKTVPTVGKPPIQVARLSFSLSGQELPEGWELHRMPDCIRFCCNPDHLQAKPNHKGAGIGRESGNPKGTPENLGKTSRNRGGDKRPEWSRRMRGNSLRNGGGLRKEFAS